MHPIFKDREEEAAGHSIGSAIEAAMGASEFLIVVCSPRSSQSQWVNREVAWFKTHRDPSKILAIIVDGEPMASTMPGREAEECFPKTLLYKTGADLQPTDVPEDAPLAADARETGDGKRGAKLKLAAAMLGVGYDALHRRDDRRRAQRRRIAMSAMAALIALLGGLTIFSFTQRNAAIAARNEAVVARNDAQFQRDEAQSLVEFMLTDLRQRLDAVGRLDILDAVAERLNESYAKQDLSKLDADSLGRRARVLLLLGEVEGVRGKLDAALARYKEAAAATEELLRRAPDDQQRIFDHAQSVYWVGDIALKRGDMATVTDYWTQYRDFGVRLVELDPDKDDWKTELAYGHRNLASLAFDRGDANAAEIGFRRASEISSAMANASRDDRALQLNQADDIMWLALSLERLSRYPEAAAALDIEAAIYERLLSNSPHDDDVLQRKAVNGRVRARISLARGDSKSALALLSSLLTLHGERLAQEPNNTRWLWYFSMLHIDAGELLHNLDQNEDARRHATTALDAANQLLSIDSTVSDWLLTAQCPARLLLASIAASTADATNVKFSAIDESLDDVERAARAVLKSGPSIYADLVLARTQILRAEIAGDMLGAEQARMFARTAEPHFGSVLSVSGDLYKTLAIQGYMLGGRLGEAAALSKSLEEAGYRHPHFVRLQNELLAQEAGRLTTRRN